jgi:hypothetical protein
LWSKTPSGTIKYYTQNSDLSVYATTGSNSFNGNQTVTGSLTVTGGVTGTSTTASYVEYTGVANKPTLVSGSEQVSFNGIVDKPTLVSGSSQITYSGISSIPAGIVSSSTQITGYNIFATTGSNQFNGAQAITGSLTVTGQVVAQTLNVQQVTSSIVYSSGSNVFGNNVSNTQQFTGSVSVTGSMAVNSSITVTGDGSNDMFKAVRSGVTRVVIKNGVNTLGINTDTINNPLTVNGGADFSGNVGIGVTGPSNKLEVVGAGLFGSHGAGSYSLAISNNDQSNVRLRITNAGSGGQSFSIVGGNPGVSNAGLAIFDETNSLTRLYVASGGNVGIGVTDLGPDGLSLASGLNYSWSEGSGNAYAVLFRQRNSAATVVASGYKRSGTAGFASSFGTSMARAAIAVGSNNGSIAFFSDSATNVANGTDITPTERMTILNNGNVGISNDSPVTRLTLGGYTGARLPYINGTANTFSGNGITVTSTNSGNAAIGGGLDLTNNTYSVNAYSPIISFSSLSLSAAYNNAYAGIWGQFLGPGGDSNWNVGALVFGTAGSYGIAERMRIRNDGNVGIGTDSPSSLLTVAGDSALAWFSASSHLRISRSGSVARLQNYQDGSVANILLNWEGGNVGIGLTNPGAILDVSHTAGTTNIIRVSNGAGNYRWRVDQNFSMVMTNASNVDTFSVNTSGTGFFAGNLGVGRSSPRGRVEFVTGLPTSYPNMADTSNGVILSDGGAIGCRLGTADRTSASQGYPTYIQAGDLTTSTLYYDLRFNPNGGAVFAGSVRLDTLSDERVKDNIQPIQGALNKILSITGKKFHLKDEPEDKLRYGFIAQDLEGILDEFVIQSDTTFKKDDLVVENVKSIENWASSWAALLVESIKEQQSQIESLKSENDTLKSILQRNNIS